MKKTYTTNYTLKAGITLLATLMMPSMAARDVPSPVFLEDHAIPAEVAPTPGLTISGYFSFENRYVTEGIDNDPDADAYFFSELALETMGFTLGAFYAQALKGSPENEVNLFLEYGFDIRGFETFVGVQYLIYPATDEANSWEAFIGFEWPVHDFVNLYGEFFYDFDEIDGGFIELGVSSEIPQPLENLVLEPYVQVGIDFGYLRENRRLRENNVQIGLVAVYEITEAFSLFGAINHSFALRNLDNLDEGDVTWGGGGLAFSF